MDLNGLKSEISEGLKSLGYPGPGFESPDAAGLAIDGGTESKTFTDAVAWLSAELHDLQSLEEKIHPPDSPEDASSFLLELSSFLKELECPYGSLTDGPISQRLASVEQRSQLLYFLCSELRAARMIAHKSLSVPSSSSAQPMEVESDTAANLRLMCQALGLSKPPDTITSKQMFDKLLAKVKEQMANPNAKTSLKKPLVDPGALLSTKQWKVLEDLNEDLKAEYKMRFELLLKRLDVSVTSFTWSDRVKKMEGKLGEIYKPRRVKLSQGSRIGIADVLAARQDLTMIEKTCGSRVRKNTQSKINRVIMKGKMPDRGGRPSEIEPPPPEMPPWQKERAQAQGGYGGGGRGGGGGGGGGRGGGRVQGGWSGGGGGGGGRGGGGSHGYAGFQDNRGRGGGYQQNYGGGGHGGGYGGGQQNYGGGGGYQNQGYQQSNYGNYGGGGGGHYQQGGGNYHQGGGDFQRYGGSGQQGGNYGGGGGGGGGRGRGRGGRGRGRGHSHYQY